MSSRAFLIGLCLSWGGASLAAQTPPAEAPQRPQEGRDKDPKSPKGSGKTGGGEQPIINDPGGDGGGGGGGASNTPVDVRLTVPATPISVVAGTATTFTAATTTPATTFTWTWGDGTANSTGISPSHTYGAGGTFTLSLKGVSSGYLTTTNTYTVTVTLPPPPTVTFTASPTRIKLGTSSTLSWTATNSTSRTLTGVGSVAATGTQTVSPTVTTTYTLAATNLGGTTNATATVAINQAPSFTTSLGNQTLPAQTYAGFYLPAATDPEGMPLSYQVTGLPPGLAFYPETRFIEGTPTTPGTYAVTLKVIDDLGDFGTQALTFTVTANAGSGGAPVAPQLPTNLAAFTAAKAQFTETLAYEWTDGAGAQRSDTGLITAVDVLRPLMAGLASATGQATRDLATRSSYTYAYDALGQLIAAKGGFFNPSNATTTPDWTDNTIYAYDRHGNRTTHTPSGKGAWNYITGASNNQLLKAGPNADGTGAYGFTYDENGVVTKIDKVTDKGAETQWLAYADPRFMRLATYMRRDTADGRRVESTLRYDMSGTRVYKRDWIRQGPLSDTFDAQGQVLTRDTAAAKLLSDRETMYLANGTEVLMEVEKRGAQGVAASERYTAYIFGAGSRLARLGWDTDGRGAGEALAVANGDLAQGLAGYTASNGITLGTITDATTGPALKVPTNGTTSYGEHALGTFKPGETAQLSLLARVDSSVTAGLQMVDGSGATVATATGTTAGAWTTLTLNYTVPAGASAPVDLRARLTATSTVVNLGAYFDSLALKRLYPAPTATGQPNLWPDPGFEGVLRPDASVTLTGNVALQAEGTNREGLHVLSIGAGGTYQRTISGLSPSTAYAFSIWTNPGTGWVRSTSTPTSTASGTLSLSLTAPGLYDQAELTLPTSPVAEGWIPENRLGRVDWFLTDHLGSTKLLMSQEGSWRFTGDDDPFGVNLREIGDDDPHRFAGHLFDKEHDLYYFGARLYLPEIGRYISTDPANQFHGSYVYVGNHPTMSIDPDGKWEQQGHFYMPYVAALAVGFNNNKAGNLGAAAWEPDTDGRSATSQASMNDRHRKNWIQIHKLCGDDAKDVQAKSLALADSLIMNSQGLANLGDKEGQNILHGKGDSRAHERSFLGIMYGSIIGHGFRSLLAKFGLATDPDNPYYHKQAFIKDAGEWYDILLKSANTNNNIIVMGKDEFIQRITKVTMVKDKGEQIQILKDLANELNARQGHPGIPLAEPKPPLAMGGQ